MADDKSRDEVGSATPDEPGPAVDPWAEAAPVGGDEGDARPAAGTPEAPGALDKTVIGGPDPVKPVVGPAGTGILPAVVDAADPPKWSARAQVRAPDPRDEQEDLAHWGEGAGEPPRGLLLPVVIGAAALLLLAVIGIGLWLVFRNKDAGLNPSTTDTPTATSTPSSITSPTITATQPPTSAAPALVAIPGVAGLDYATAAAKLQSLGLAVTRANDVSGTVPAGVVIETNPPEGTQVLPGVTVTIVVSSGPPAVTTPPPTHTATHTASPAPSVTHAA